jgi:hypothetical protein
MALLSVFGFFTMCMLVCSEHALPVSGWSSTVSAPQSYPLQVQARSSVGCPTNDLELVAHEHSLSRLVRLFINSAFSKRIDHRETFCERMKRRL